MPFKKGQSGNKKGRPKLDEVEKQNVAYFKQQLKRYSVVALEELYDLMCNSFNPEIRYKCATYILDRSYGKDFVAEKAEDDNKNIKIQLFVKDGKEVDQTEISKIEEDIWNDVEDESDDDWGLDDIYYGNKGE